MEEQTPNYRTEFLRSPQHAWLAVATLGLGFLSASLLGLIAGITVYALGWIYLPDMDFFKSWVERNREAERRAAALAQVADFIRRRDALLRSLSPLRKQRYDTLAEVCRNIESAGGGNYLTPDDPAADPRLRKLDELMWTYLRLLSIEESLERFMEIERRENVPQLVRDAEQEANRLKGEIEALKAKGGVDPTAKQRLLDSRQELLAVLKKRGQRAEQAESNLALVVSEQERLDQQIKLIRADAVAIKNAETLTARIDATVEHLDATNKWLSELDEFKDLVGDMPQAEARIGYEPTVVAPPPLARQTSVPIPPRISSRGGR